MTNRIPIDEMEAVAKARGLEIEYDRELNIAVLYVGRKQYVATLPAIEAQP